MKTPTTAQKLAAAKKLAIAHQQRIRKEGAAAAMRILSTPRSAFGKFNSIPRHILPAQLIGHRQEIKSVDIPIAANSPQVSQLSTTPNFYSLNPVQEGASFYNRIGRKIMNRSLHITGFIQATSDNNPGGAEYNRIMVIYDRQPNGSFPVIADILTDYDNAGATKTTAYSHLNMNNSERFIMLRDCRFVCNDNTQGNTNEQNTAVTDYYNKCNFNEFIRCKDLETHYQSTTNPGAIGDCSSGALLLVTFGTQILANSNFSLFWTCRLRFHDV